MARSMGSHHLPNQGKNDEWLTPPFVVDALGPFNLDPCSPINRPWSTATRHLTIDDDGLNATWADDEFVWLNPPYGPHTWKWLERLATHPAGGIALIFARTETVGFFSTAWQNADAMFFLEGRLFFHYVDGTRAPFNSGAPSVLLGYGAEAVTRLNTCNLNGAFVPHWIRREAA